MRSASEGLYLLFGHPVAHALSPALYGALFARHGLRARYQAVDVPPPGLGQAVADARATGVAGFNLTAPHKEHILGLLDRVEGDAARFGAANVVLRRGDALVGHNTDGEGLCRALELSCPLALRGAHAVVLGAGGTGRAVAGALLARGAGRVVLLNRTLARAERVAAALDEGVEAGALSREALLALGRGASLVVNATTPAADAAVAALDLTALGPELVWVDLNYSRAAAPQAEAVAARGGRFRSGLDMLVQQGLLAFSLFTDLPTPAAHMPDLLEAR